MKNETHAKFKDENNSLTKNKFLTTQSKLIVFFFVYLLYLVSIIWNLANTILKKKCSKFLQE